MKKNWQIVTEYIIAHEDEFMEYLESEHDIEGSDMDFILKKIDARLKRLEGGGLVISAIARRKGHNGRTKRHYLVGDRWFDLEELAAIVPVNVEGKHLSAQALNGRICQADTPLNNPDILKPRLTTAERVVFAAAARKNSHRGRTAADTTADATTTTTNPDTIGCAQRAKLAAIPLGIYDNI